MSKLAGFLFLGACLSAHATSCLGPITVCSSFTASSVVFRGRVVEVIPHVSQGVPVTHPDGSTDMAYEVPMTEDFRFEVQEAFKGNLGHEVTLTGGNEEFRQGQGYLVFGSVNPATQAVLTSVCSGNHSLDNPDQDPDLVWLRAYPTAPPTAKIFGKVSMGYGVSDVPSITIELSGEKRFSATSAEDHAYAFKDLPPGTYTVTATAPAGYTTIDRDPATVSVAAKGCAEIDWAIRLDTHIRGTVTEAGNPVFGAQIGLLRPAENRIGFEIVASQNTDTKGNYAFSKVQPGDYWVALDYLGPNNHEPHAPVFYPSGENASSAKLIHLDATRNIDHIDLVLTPALNPVNIHVHVEDPDGSPVVKAHVIASDPLTPTQAMSTTADENGNADITVYEGREYRLIASTSGNREPACAGPIRFIVKQGLQVGTLTLDKSWNQCRALQKAR